ncbi:MAG: murein biosynthesis integral membrane protein MurJ [Candidatus Zixiibacteriota bacterium]
MSRKTAISIGKVGLIKGFAKALAFLKTILIAKFFGASGMTDAWYVAYTIPEMLTSFLGFQDIKGATTSIFSHYDESNPSEFNRAFSAIFNMLLILGFVVSIIAVVFAGFLVSITAHDLDPELLELATELARIVLPVIVFMGLSNFLMSVLNSREFFLVPAIVQLMSNIIAVSIILLLHKHLGINSVAWGILLGWFGAMIIQIPFMLKAKIKYKPFYFGEFKAIKSFITFFSPLFIPIFASQINALVIKNLGSTLRPLGKITAYSYAILIVGSIISLAVEPFTIVLLPRISRLVAQEAFEKLGKLVQRYAKYFMIIFLPISTFMILNTPAIVSIVFQRGEFDKYAHSITSIALIAASTSILPWAMNLYYKLYFLAMKQTRTIATIDVITIAFHIGMNFLLTHLFGLFGLVFAATLAYTARFLIYGIITGKNLKQCNFTKLLLYLLGLLPSAGLLLLISYLGKTYLHFDSQYNDLFIVIISFVAGFSVYFGTLYILRNREIIDISHRVLRKIKK